MTPMTGHVSNVSNEERKREDNILEKQPTREIEKNESTLQSRAWQLLLLLLPRNSLQTALLFLSTPKLDSLDPIRKITRKKLEQ